MTDFSDPEAVARKLHAEYVAEIEEVLSDISADDRGTTIVSRLDGTRVALSRKSVSRGVQPVADLRRGVQDSVAEAYHVHQQLYSWGCGYKH